MVVGEPHDREVGEDAAGRVEERRVDGPARAYVHLVDTQSLERGEGAGSGDVEDRERGQVHQTGPVPHREVLGVDERAPPARIPFRGPRHDPLPVLGEERLVRCVPERPLPAGGLEGDGAELRMADRGGRAPDGPVALPLLHRMDDAVGLVEALGRPGVDVLPGLVVVVEAGDIRAVRIDLGRAVGHPLGDALRDPGRLLDPDRGDRPEVPDLGGLADDRVAVRSQAQESVDRELHADLLVTHDRREELEGILQLRIEVLLGEREHRR